MLTIKQQGEYNKIKRVEVFMNKYLKRTLLIASSHDYYIFHNHALAAASSAKYFDKKQIRQ